jgi:hypothetical protein
MRTLTVTALLHVALVTVIGSVQAADEPKPPSITYGGNRSSSTWVDTPKGRVAVDEGIEWQGIKVYLSLTWDLVAVDVKTSKTLWSQNVSAFWNGLAIKEVEAEMGKKTWAVELRTTARDPDVRKLVVYHDLKTGKAITLPGQAEKVAGKAFKLRGVYSGQTSSLDKPFTLVVSTAENWAKVRTRMFAEGVKASAPEAKDVDFGKEILLVVSYGDSYNCRGLGVAESYEDDKRILVRMHAQTFQTVGPDGGGVRCRPYGIFVLPRAEKKAYVVERNRQRYIAGPPLWAEHVRFDALPDAAKELEQLP